LNAILESLHNYTHGMVRLPAPREGQILIVDDDEAYRESLCKWCVKRGYPALTASGGSDALRLMKEDPSIDIVLLDIKLPDMGGMEVLATICKWLHHPQVIVMTAIEDSVIAQQARQLGAFDYIVKPAETSVLEQSIVACLAHAEYQRQSWWKRLRR
jgi:DNA-binding NtrC family response regulator